MENAAKALLMAGGILIALLIIGALMLMFNQVGSYQQSESDNLKNSQLVDFNKQYTQYAEDIYGYEFISLINKVVDYNEKKPDIGNEFAYQQITVKVNLGNFAGKSNYFDANYEIVNKQSDLYKKIYHFRHDFEDTYGLATMSKLSANYDSILRYVELKKDRASDGAIDIELGKSTRVFIESHRDISTKDIEEYREYSEFKKIKLKCTKEDYYNNSQIKELDFEYIE